MSTFSKPAEPTGFKWEDHSGDLIIVEPLEVEKGITTTFGDKDAIRSNVAVLDGDHKGDRYDDTLVFPLVLQGQLRPSVNEGGGVYVVGRLGQGVAKPGQKPPWKILDPTDDELTTARKYVEHYSTQAVKQPETESEPF